MESDSEVPRLTHVLVLVPLSHSICLGKLTSQLHAVLARLGLRDVFFFFSFLFCFVLGLVSNLAGGWLVGLGLIQAKGTS